MPRVVDCPEISWVFEHAIYRDALGFVATAHAVIVDGPESHRLPAIRAAFGSAHVVDVLRVLARFDLGSIGELDGM